MEPSGPAVIVHNVRSLHNVGSIFRTADGAGFQSIYLTGITPEPIDRFERLRPEFAKVALGAEQNITWKKSARIGPLLARLKKAGYIIYAIEQAPRALPWKRWPEAARNHTAANSKIALIMGAEVDGLPKVILDKADAILEIPMRGGKESLNVAVAFGIAAYRLAPEMGYNSRVPRL